jgi:hypothetical protein
MDFNLGRIERDWRSSGITAQDVGTILKKEKDPRSYYLLFLEKQRSSLERDLEEPERVDAELIWQKKRCRELLKKYYAIDVEPINLEMDEWPVARAKLDGIYSDAETSSNLSIEIMGDLEFEDFRSGLISDRIVARLQHELMVTGLQRSIIVGWRPNSEDILLGEIFKKDEMINELFKAELEFWRVVQITKNTRRHSFNPMVKGAANETSRFGKEIS